MASCFLPLRSLFVQSFVVPSYMGFEIRPRTFPLPQDCYFLASKIITYLNSSCMKLFILCLIEWREANCSKKEYEQKRVHLSIILLAASTTNAIPVISVHKILKDLSISVVDEEKTLLTCSYLSICIVLVGLFSGKSKFS